jgi:hypothetical protein
MELVAVTSVNDTGLASIIRGVLEQAGIEAVISGTGAEDAFPPGTLGSLQVMVAESDVERARDLLEQYETAPEADEEDD